MEALFLFQEANTRSKLCIPQRNALQVISLSATNFTANIINFVQDRKGPLQTDVEVFYKSVFSDAVYVLRVYFYSLEKKVPRCKNEKCGNQSADS
jgi:hypothetical protein